MIDPEKIPTRENDHSGAESDRALSPAAIPNAAPTFDSRTVPSVPINPDELHDLFGDPLAEDADDPLAQLRLDPNYAALLKDLEAIRDAAKQLFAPSEPSDDLWNKIQSQLPGKESN